VSFLSVLFLWASIFAGVPVVIALWNRKRHRQEKFGGFYLLRQVFETTQRRIRLLELIKLLNRICLFLLLVFIFAQPFKRTQILSKAEEGFAILLDTGRVMQSVTEDGQSLIQLQEQKVNEILQKLPPQAQGVILFVSDRCDSLKLENQRMTGTAGDWKKIFRAEKVGYSNFPTKSEGLLQCLSRVETLFSRKNIFVSFISPLPDSLDAVQLKKTKIEIEKLPTTWKVDLQGISVMQEQKGEKVRVHLSPPASREASLIRVLGKSESRVERLGSVQESVDLSAAGQSWLWIQNQETRDPWISSRLIPVQQQESYQIILWAMKETPGFQSLLAALRNYPHLKVIRQVGGKPAEGQKGDPIILYGDNTYTSEDFQHSWSFVNPDGQSPFPVRDKKQWSPGSSSADVQRSFQMQTQDGKIFIRKYQLLNLDRFETLETFEDGAPSLLRDRQSSFRRWISPFDLEDLTTDVSLEPTFIPYLYRRLEKWLSPESAHANEASLTPVWLMPGRLKPTKEVILRQGWPGIYIGESTTKVVEPILLPQKFLSLNSAPAEEVTREEKISERPKLIRWVSISLFLELLLCLLSARIIALLLLSVVFYATGSTSVMAASALRPIKLGIFSGMDVDRSLALTQFEEDAERMSNLDFDKPVEVRFDKVWENSILIISSTHEFGPFKKEDREKIRDYCERGGLLFFDDPLATSESAFYKSVRRELNEIFPLRPLKQISKEDVIFRTFYLLSEVSGRKLASPYIEGIELDKRWVALFSFNDLLGANLRTARGDYAFSVTPYGISQRVLAKRLLLNILMYSVTLDYKDDAIHLPHILKRRSR
jgi:hypothetical protein